MKMPSTNKILAAGGVFLLVLFVVVIFALLIMYATSTGLFKPDPAPFKSGFQSNQERIVNFNPTIVLSAGLDSLINGQGTGSNIDIRAAHDLFNEFLSKPDPNTPKNIYEGANQILELIYTNGDDLRGPSNENKRFMNMLISFRNALNDYLDANMLLANKISGVDPVLNEINKQRIAANSDAAMEQWVRSIQVNTDETDLREFAIENLTGKGDAGFADTYANNISCNREYVGGARPPALTPGPNGKMPQFPFKGAKSIRGLIQDFEIDEVGPGDQKDRPTGTGIGLISHIQRDHETYSPFTESGIRR